MEKTQSVCRKAQLRLRLNGQASDGLPAKPVSASSRRRFPLLERSSQDLAQSYRGRLTLPESGRSRQLRLKTTDAHPPSESQGPSHLTKSPLLALCKWTASPTDSPL